MKLSWLPWLLCAACVFTACSREEEDTVQIVRNPVIAFSTDTLVWQSGSYFFLNPIQVVRYPAQAVGSAKIYTRYSLQATGKDNKGSTLQLNLLFDAGERDQLMGVYRAAYTEQRGLAGVHLYNLQNGQLAAYKLSLQDTATATLHIRRQYEKERLISGTFEMTLSNEQDTSKKIRIRDGVLQDLRY